MDAWTSVSRNPHRLAVWLAVCPGPPSALAGLGFLQSRVCTPATLQHGRETPGAPGLALVEFSWPQRVSHRSHVKLVFPQG